MRHQIASCQCIAAASNCSPAYRSNGTLASNTSLPSLAVLHELSERLVDRTGTVYPDLINSCMAPPEEYSFTKPWGRAKAGRRGGHFARVRLRHTPSGQAVRPRRRYCGRVERTCFPRAERVLHVVASWDSSRGSLAACCADRYNWHRNNTSRGEQFITGAASAVYTPSTLRGDREAVPNPNEGRVVRLDTCCFPIEESASE